MNKASDVIVIGAGRRRMRRRLLSGKARGKGNSSGAQGSCLRCTGRNGSGARQSGRDNRELPLAMFGVKHIWPTLGEELGEDIEYIQNGNMQPW